MFLFSSSLIPSFPVAGSPHCRSLCVCISHFSASAPRQWPASSASLRRSDWPLCLSFGADLFILFSFYGKLRARRQREKPSCPLCVRKRLASSLCYVLFLSFFLCCKSSRCSPKGTEPATKKEAILVQAVTWMNFKAKEGKKVCLGLSSEASTYVWAWCVWTKLKMMIIFEYKRCRLRHRSGASVCSSKTRPACSSLVVSEITTLWRAWAGKWSCPCRVSERKILPAETWNWKFNYDMRGMKLQSTECIEFICVGIMKTSTFPAARRGGRRWMNVGLY